MNGDRRTRRALRHLVTREVMCLRPAGPIVNSHVREGVDQTSKLRWSAEGAEQLLSKVSVGPSGLKRYCTFDPRPHGRGY